MRMHVRSSIPVALLVIVVACSKAAVKPDSGQAQADGGPSADATAPLPTGLSSRMTSTRFITADHMLASYEMQLSGEPFAQLLGYNLNGFNRYSTTTDQYTDPATNKTTNDPLAYALAIESYEYSKQPMNNLAFESGAGLALQFGPVLNPAGVTNEDAYKLMVARLQRFAQHSSAAGGFVVSPAPANNRLNHYGWPGFWPAFAPFASFDPTIAPSAGATRGCTLAGGYGAAASGAQIVGDYECGYNSLNLANREAAVEKVLRLDAMGHALWKQGLWILNYWQTMHDLQGNAIVTVADADIPKVGQAGNTVVGSFADPADPTGKKLVAGAAGTFLGDTAIEGYQGLTMMEEADNQAAFLNKSLVTMDGATLGGFPSTQAALDYTFTSPVAWWPSAVTVTETPTAPSPDLTTRYFPKPTGLAVAAPESTLRGLLAILGGYGEIFSVTDASNPDVGGSVPCRATFDGDPFPPDDQKPSGENTLHDRTLAVLKVGLVNLERLHYAPSAQTYVSSASVSGGKVTQGTTVSAVDLAYTIVGLRTALRSITSSLTLYSNDTPDQLGAASALDATKWDGAPFQGPLSTYLGARIHAAAAFIAKRLVDDTGAVANSFDLATGKRDTAATTLEAEASAMRGLLEAYLATSDDTFRERAQLVFADMEKRFWMGDINLYRTTADNPSTMTYTPLAFGTLHGALRQYYKLVGARPGNAVVGKTVLGRIKRTFKVVVNGWNDLNGDDVVQAPAECLEGRLQMGERALTGELSLPADNGDRDRDCVTEISVLGLPSALAAQVVFVRK